MSDGKAVLASDEVVEPLTIDSMAGAEYHRLWGGDEAPSFPDAGQPPEQPTFFPPVGGYRSTFFSVAPAGAEPPADVDPNEAAASDRNRVLPGMTSYMEPDDPGMHTTDTIDFEVVISGGSRTWSSTTAPRSTLRAGDTVVQNGTRHRWTNRGIRASGARRVHRRRTPPLSRHPHWTTGEPRK